MALDVDDDPWWSAPGAARQPFLAALDGVQRHGVKALEGLEGRLRRWVGRARRRDLNPMTREHAQIVVARLGAAAATLEASAVSSASGASPFDFLTVILKTPGSPNTSAH